MPDARATATCLLTGLCWGLAPWVPDHGLLVFAAAVGFGWLLPDRPVLAGLAAGLGCALQLGWLPAAWRDGPGGSPWGPFVGIVLLQAWVPALGCAVAARSRLERPVAVGLAFAAVALLDELQPLPVGHALLLADDTHAWLWPAGIGGPALVSGLVAGWGALAWERPAWAGGLLLAWGAVGLALPALPDPGAPFVVGVIQPDVDVWTGRTPSHGPALEARIHALLAALPAVDLVVTPEGAWPHDPGRGPGARRDALTAALGGPILLGATVGDEEPRLNAMIALDDGVRAQVVKAKLVPVWERRVLGLGADRYAPGSGAAIAGIAGIRAGVLICYEDLFASRVRAAATADLLVTASNDGWNGPGAGSRAHLGASRLAAATTGLWVVRPTLSGRSAVFDRFGRTVWEAPWLAGVFGETPGHARAVEVRVGSGWRPGPWMHGVVAGLAALALIPGRRRAP